MEWNLYCPRKCTNTQVHNSHARDSTQINKSSMYKNDSLNVRGTSGNKSLLAPLSAVEFVEVLEKRNLVRVCTIPVTTV